MPKLSVIMIVKNEVDCLGDCLSSVQAIADEIVVGDTGSTDDTAAIAKSFGARVLDVEWNDNFADARNRVLDSATGDWLLHMDADEALDPEGAKRIRAIVDADGDGAGAIFTTMANYCEDTRAWRWVPSEPGNSYARGFSGYVAVALVRLFKNGLGIEYRERVHENLGESIAENGVELRAEAITIHHYGFAATHHRSKEKNRYYLELAREKAKLQPGEAKVWFDLAAACSTCEEREDAIEAAQKALCLEPDHVDAAHTLAHLYLGKREFTKARKLIENFVRSERSPVHFLSLLGVIARIEGRFTDAKSYFENALDLDPKNVVSLLDLSRTYDQTGETREARAQLEQARAVSPNLKEPKERLAAIRLREEGEALFAAGEPVQALERFVEGLRLDGEDPVLHNNTGVLLNNLGRPEDARSSFERALKLAPAMQSALTNLESVS